MSAEPFVLREPMDDIRDRLNDPVVAQAVVLLLDHVEGLAVLAMGTDGFLRRGNTIMDTLADALGDAKAVAAASDLDLATAREQAQQLLRLTGSVAESSGDISMLLQSGMLRGEVLTLLGQTADALVEAREQATDAEPEITGPVSAFRVLRDPEVQKGLTFLVGVARSLGRRMDS